MSIQADSDNRFSSGFFWGWVVFWLVINSGNCNVIPRDQCVKAPIGVEQTK